MVNYQWSITNCQLSMITRVGNPPVGAYRIRPSPYPVAGSFAPVEAFVWRMRVRPSPYPVAGSFAPCWGCRDEL